MIPEERASTQTFSGQLLNPWSRDRKISYQWGPVQVQDPSRGLLAKLWTLKAVGGSAVLSAPGSATITVFTRPTVIDNVNLAFDQNGRPCVCFEEEDGGTYLYWFDPVANDNVFMPVVGITPRITLDDARAFNGPNSDVILAYVRTGVVRYRRQRDRFDTEYTLLVGEAGPPATANGLRHISMNSNLRMEFLTADTSGDLQWSVGEVIEDLCIRAGLSPESIWVSELYGDFLEGYKIDSDEDVADALKPLLEGFFIDPVEHDRKLRFLRRGRSPVMRITWRDLIDNNPPMKITRVQEDKLPRRVDVNHIDPAGAYAKNKQYAHRKSNLVDAKGKLKITLAYVATADQAAAVAHRTIKSKWHEQMKYEFALPRKFAALTNGDVIEYVDKKNNIHRIRLEERNDDGKTIDFKGVQDGGAAVYDTNAVGLSLPPPRSTTPGLVGETRLELLNIPVMRDQDDELGLYIAASGDSSAWAGAQIMVSTDDGANYFEAFRTDAPATLGDTETVLEAEVSAEYPSDQTVIVKTNFALESVTRESLLNGLNRCVIGDEVLQFETATHLGDNRFLLGGLVRGRYNTEPVEWPIGTRFVLLDSAVGFVQAQHWMLGMDILFKPVGFGTTQDEAVPTAYLFEEAESQTEWPPHHVVAERDVADSVTVTWVPRPRLGAEVAPFNSKYFTGYKILFSDGFSATTTSLSYTRASTPVGATVKICGINSITGDGDYSEEVAT